MLSVLMLSGCATGALDMAPPTANTPWAPVVDRAGAIRPGSASGNAGAGYLLPPNPAVARLPSSPAINPSHAYTLAELIDIAESNNPETRIAWDQARDSALAAGIAESTYLPQVTVSVVGAYQDTGTHSGGGGVAGSSSDEAHGVISAVSLNWLLFDFGERAAIIQAAKQATVISDIAFTAAHQQLIYNVSLAFYGYVASHGRVADTAKSLRNAEDIEAAAKARYAHGIGTIVDADQAIEATAQARLDVAQAKGRAQDAYLALLTAMGVSPLTKLSIAIPPMRPLSPALDKPVQAIVATALARRPDTLRAYAAEQASLAKIQAARAEFMPKFFLSATGGFSSTGLAITAIPGVGQQQGTFNLAGSHVNGAILAGLTVPLYDGGTREANLEQAEARADSAGAALKRTREEAARQVVAAANNVRTTLAAYSAAKALAAAAQTSFNAAYAAYRHGVGSVTKATLADTKLLQARQAATDAYSAGLSAAASLAFTTGALGGVLHPPRP